MFPFDAHHPSIVGLDIGTASIKAVELRRAGKGWNLHRIGFKSLPPKAVTNGKIKDKEIVVQLLRDLWTEARFGSKRVAIAVGGPSVIIKRIQLPLMTELDLEDQISLEAEEHIPFDIEDVYLDFQILGRTGEQMDVLLSACKKELVDNRLEAPREAGLNPVLCDLDLFCVANAFESFCMPTAKKPQAKKTPPPEKGEKGEATALINIGSAHLNVAIIANGMPDFTRDHAFGSERMVQEIMQNQGISFEAAELLIQQHKESQNSAWPPENRTPIVQSFLDQLGNLVKQSVEFYQTGHTNQAVSTIYLSGGCAILPEMVSTLNEFLNLPVRTANPLAGVHGKIPTTVPAETSPSFMVAMGLAVRGDAK
ncbi:MAG: type IV pilus assembly protein PilM [Magnetococcales bacterium]|nr:type IV pilus assembly protein PilM [Magnetococcales bacterium]